MKKSADFREKHPLLVSDRAKQRVLFSRNSTDQCAPETI